MSETITYAELARRLNACKLFNKAPELDENIYEGLENGSLGNDECEYEYDGKDTDGTKWYKCNTHDELAPSPDAPCAGYGEMPEIYQWYLIDPSDADYLKRNTDELIFYSEVLDEYVWGVTHFGTAWEGVTLEFGKKEEASND